MSPSRRPTAGQGLLIPVEAVAEIRSHLPSVADDVVAAIIEEVPSYADAFGGRMGETIRNAVQLALGGFLSLAGGTPGAEPRTPAAPAVEGAYQLGRGEARSGRSTDALLAAYRIGARVSWREMSTYAVAAGLSAETLVSFAELVFAYIDELSAASVAGHTDELATSGRVRQRLLERIAHHLLVGSPAETVTSAAERAGWAQPETLTAVIVPESQVRPVLAELSPQTLQTELPDLDEVALLLVPDAHGRARGALLRTVADRSCVAGPARPWLDVRASYDRAMRARASGLDGDTEAHLVRLVLTADADALADLCADALAPLAGLRPGVAEKLADTLRAWLLHQGRRDDVAEALFVHPQTVRYRMGQLRDLYGDRLEDPQTVLALTIALGASVP
ncbi:helix-turn-helix domain-containing protein [Nocardioides sp. cx-169]|uniref:PucR family transcriptional regulator n=1 Tax=Nocardioides sp. cx-169 TaxID=2899080 RepID=UPI001E61CECB|nr:helix-turn-helix domain-containing protein [Nocardioides sp. cx-169]MCD4533309.1 helix-turn-helix domain-containing protein [Nocardioides sp. cx-169]